MSITIGGGLNTVKDLYIGNKKIEKAYVGNKLVYNSKIIWLIKEGVPNNKNCLKYLPTQTYKELTQWNGYLAFDGIFGGYGTTFGVLKYDTTKYKGYIKGTIGIYMSNTNGGTNRWSLMGSAMASQSGVVNRSLYYSDFTPLVYSYVSNQYGSEIGYGAAAMINAGSAGMMYIKMYFGMTKNDNLYLEKI